MPSTPGDLILEPNEKILLATRPLFLWEPLVLIDIALIVASLFFAAPATASYTLSGLAAVLAVLLALWLFLKWIPWRARWYVLTDRRVIARWGVLNKNQAALLLDRIQDASLTRPFPLSIFRDYGTIHIESAGEHAEERISGGLDELDMTGASKFYRALTDAQTKD